jgi:hypothetical protein
MSSTAEILKEFGTSPAKDVAVPPDQQADSVIAKVPGTNHHAVLSSVSPQTNDAPQNENKSELTQQPKNGCRIGKEIVEQFRAKFNPAALLQNNKR